jgi:3-deoxy-D-manno-octulosonic-acid transferase
LFLVLVPRHFERAQQVGRILNKRGVRFFYRSEITAGTRLEPGSLDCLLVDTTGELISFYQHATICFVGKSLTAKGGQNPIEPAALGKPTLFGPNMQNFSDAVRILTSQDGAIQVHNAVELEACLADLLSNPARREQLGTAAKRIVQENQGAVARTVEMVLEHLDPTKAKTRPA